MGHRRLFSLLFLLAVLPAVRAQVSPLYQTATQARVSGAYLMVVLADGSKSMVPLASLTPEDRTWLMDLSQRQPLAKGGSQVTVVAAATLSPAAKTKKTIEVSTIEGPLETVRLCQPNLLRDQIGGTCMLYARIHWLDIAGYYIKTTDIYKFINGTPPDAPWTEPRYVAGLQSIIADRTPQPVRHRRPLHEDEFTWARAELRKGRPLLGAFPREIWQALPPGFVAAHPWNGGSVGHQIVVNGFTWNRETRRGTFHIINSWAELPSFEITTEAAADGVLMIEESLSPLGEGPAASPVSREVVQSIRFVKTMGAVNLYEVQTNLETRRMLAASEDAVRDLVEKVSP